MRLPNADRAIIPEAKLRDYILNPDHARNQGKARLFMALGYSRQDWARLETDIRQQHLAADAIELTKNDYGRKWAIEAPLRGPNGEATIRTVWIVDFQSGVPRLLTAYRVRSWPS
jgi:hypothetical protein